MVGMSGRRQPIVAVLGHVDHGKTTLLDALRGAKTADLEAGGITQALAAFSAEGPGATRATFLDTPGHADFSEDTYRTLAAADNAVMLVDGAKGLWEISEGATVRGARVATRQIP